MNSQKKLKSRKCYGVTEMEKLLNCPFCGCTDVVIRASENGVDEKVWCLDCQANIPRFKGHRYDLIAAWNRRPAPENSPLTLEQLHQMDGETVWIVTEGKCYPRTITHSDCGMLHLCDSDGRLSVLNESNHGRDWEAFAERPKETPPTDGNL